MTPPTIGYRQADDQGDIGHVGNNGADTAHSWTPERGVLHCNNFSNPEGTQGKAENCRVRGMNPAFAVTI